MTLLKGCEVRMKRTSGKVPTRLRRTPHFGLVSERASRRAAECAVPRENPPRWCERAGPGSRSGSTLRDALRWEREPERVQRHLAAGADDQHPLGTREPAGPVDDLDRTRAALEGPHQTLVLDRPERGKVHGACEPRIGRARVGQRAFVIGDGDTLLPTEAVHGVQEQVLV